MAFELGTAFMKVLPDMRAFNKQVAGSIDTKKLSRGAAIAGGAIAVGLAVGAKKALDKAVDLNEAVSATDATFERSARKVQEWSKDTNDAFSRTEFLGAAKSFGVFARAADLGDQASAEFSRGLISAAQDAASFHNALPSDVLQDFRSGLAGETEPLRKYGIILNETALEAQAVSMGLAKAKVDTELLRDQQTKASLAAKAWGDAQREHGKDSEEAQKAELAYNAASRQVTDTMKGAKVELSEQDKVLARRAFIVENLGAAEGDWGRTIESAANQERIQQANSEDLQATLGQGLIPIYERLLEVGVKVVSYFAEHTGLAKALFIGLGILAGALLSFAVALKIATVANLLFNVGIAITAGIILGVILLLVALGVGLVLLWKKSETFRNIVIGTWEAIKQVVGATVDFIRRHWELLLIALTLGTGVLVVAIVKNWDKIKNAALAAWRLLKRVLPPIFQALWNYFIKYLPVVFFIRHFGKIKQGIVDAWEWVSDRTSEIWQGILQTVEDFVNKIISILNYIPGVDIDEVRLVVAEGAPVRSERSAGLARGGMVQPPPGARGRGVYRVAEAGHPEMVIPLDARHRHRATSLLVETAERLGLVTDYGLGGIVDLGKSVGGAVLGKGAELLAKGAGWLIGKLPGIPRVADWAKGVFEWLLDRATGFIKREAPSVSGSLVEIGRQLQSMGYLVGEHPAFGGVAPVHTTNSWHYKGRALDINWPGGGPAEMAALDRLFGMLKKIPHLELLWRVADHFDHLHFAMRAGGPVRKNMAHLVGEGGPELFIPSSAGTILPNHELQAQGYAIVDLERARVWVERHAEAVVAGRSRLTRQQARMGAAA